MKNIKSVYFAAIFFALAVSCTSAVSGSQNLEREWMVVYFQNFSKTDLIKAGAKISLKNHKKNGRLKGVAEMGCNRIFLNAKVKKSGKIIFSYTGSTLMECQNMEIENTFLKSLCGNKIYKAEGHFLTLTDKKGDVIKFVASDWD